MIKHRVISAFALAVVAVVMLFSPRYIQLVVFALFAIVMIQESLSIDSSKQQRISGVDLYVIALTIGYFYYPALWFLVYASVAVRIVMMLLNIRCFELFWSALLFDIGLFIISSYHLLGDQVQILLYTIVTVAVIDICGYVIGKYLGQHKIVPWISPNKTLEGYLGALLGYGLISSKLMIWQEMSANGLGIFLEEEV